MKRKKKVFVVWRDVVAYYEGRKGEPSAKEQTEKKFNIARSTLDRILRESREGRDSVPRVLKEKPILSLEFSIPENACAEIKMRNGSSGLLGTLFVFPSGLEYRRPNQKKGTGRRIAWDMLERLMQLGLV